MTENHWLAIVFLVACLVLALSGYKSRGITGRKAMLHIVIWGAIFLAIVIGFTFLGQ